MVALDENRNSPTTQTCLRLYNVKQEEDETAEDCFHKIKEIIKVAELDIPDPVIDGAHRVGIGYNNKPPAMIVKFTTSRHRTKLYRARKEIKEKLGYSLQVDLAKENLYTLKKVREVGKENRDVTGFEFAYANINCVLYMKINGNFQKFSTLEDAYRLMGIDPGDVASDDSITENNCSTSECSDDSSSSSSNSSGSSSDDPDRENDGDVKEVTSDDGDVLPIIIKNDGDERGNNDDNDCAIENQENIETDKDCQGIETIKDCQDCETDKDDKDLNEDVIEKETVDKECAPTECINDSIDGNTDQ